ncbi:hypothetical protein BOX15_Mlig002967g2 [Macrostomum lignano]|uniref:Uncharacterized protein n=2 Tax=Macrostomum lignano TaxID=282301 RepID=A0A267H4R3_9PLAT|nr:hypothetical protein BOX15_Mlig002967g1 [Macrostomum lignano]PAA92684.1 hypothetical protein BOX15_Mlig002967g2 [Macrostomum lignano]
MATGLPSGTSCTAAAVYACLALCSSLFAGTAAIEIVQSGPVSVSNLSCYECAETFNKASPWTSNTTCQTLIGLGGRPCMSSQSFCTVQISIVYDALISITRGCADSCVDGCIYDGFPMTQINCVNCCNTSFCNSMSAASRTAPAHCGTVLGLSALLMSVLSG